MKLLYVACAAAVLFAACTDRDPLSSTADPSTEYKAGKPIVSSESVAGLPEPRVPAQFTVRIENLGTVLAPGAWVAQRGGTPFFIDGQPDRGAGLEALAEDGNPAELAANLHPNSGIFNTPVGADGPGPLTPDNAYEFSFVARPGDRLSFATMYVQSNDLFLAPDETGIELFTNGLPISGDITAQIGLWDAGTEVNEEPGVGENQAPRQAGANTGADEGGTVRLVDDGFTYPAVTDIVSITVTSVGGASYGEDDGEDDGEGEGAGEGDMDDGLSGSDAAIAPEVLALTNALISYFQNALLVALTSDEATIDGTSSGTLAIAGNEWVLTDYSSDGLLVLNGTLNVGKDQFPSIPITGEITASGAFDATVSLDLLIDVSGDEPSLSGTITVGVPYDIGAIIAAAEAGDMDGDDDMDGDGEESAQQLGVNDTYDNIRAGVRLILSYDAEANAFTGTAENTTDATLEQVRVEVHLSNGTELGPTTPTDLAPGQSIPITLPATSESFDTWSAHPEVGAGGEGDGEGEHDGEGDGEGEHDGEGDGEGDGDTDGDDSSETTISSARTLSSGPAAGLPEPRVPAQFTVRIENLGTVLAPGAWVAQRGGTPIFSDGQPDRGAGLEALAEDGNPAQLAASLFNNSGVFTTPVGADGPGPLTPDNAYEFSFVARPGDRLSFATMYVQSNDLFLAPGDTGIELFTDGQPISGDITAQIDLWDAGTEVNEEPGVGENQAPRQAGANTGADEGGAVRLVDDGFTYPAVADIVSITITSSGG